MRPGYLHGGKGAQLQPPNPRRNAGNQRNQYQAHNRQPTCPSSSPFCIAGKICPDRYPAKDSGGDMNSCKDRAILFYGCAPRHCKPKKEYFVDIYSKELSSFVLFVEEIHHHAADVLYNRPEKKK